MVLCIGCLERRLGRTLCAGDFTDDMVNDPDRDISERMRQRLVATESCRLDGPKAADPEPVLVKRKRGRPRGSKNKRKPGRPKGSKNKPKVQVADRVGAAHE
jgi:hypothetical protein